VPDACRGAYPASEQWKCYFGYRLYGTLQSTCQPAIVFSVCLSVCPQKQKKTLYSSLGRIGRILAWWWTVPFGWLPNADGLRFLIYPQIPQNSPLIWRFSVKRFTRGRHRIDGGEMYGAPTDLCINFRVHFVSHILPCLFLIHLFHKSPHLLHHHYSHHPSLCHSFIPDSRHSSFTNPSLHRSSLSSGLT